MRAGNGRVITALCDLAIYLGHISRLDISAITALCDLAIYLGHISRLGISAITALCVLADREHAVDLPAMDDLRLGKQVVDALEMHLNVNSKT